MRRNRLAMVRESPGVVVVVDDELRRGAAWELW
jgi:hypothetical protein